MKENEYKRQYNYSQHVLELYSKLLFQNKPKPVDIKNFGGILTCVYCFVTGTKVTNKCPTVYHVKLTLQRKIKIKYSEIDFTHPKRSVKSIKLLLCRGCPALYSSVDKLSF